MDKTSGRALVPYDGADEYVFISYAHRDGARVRSLAANLAEKGYRVWYDEGIEVGADWPEKVAGRLADAALVLVFLSENFFRSQNCVREVHYAVDRRKPLVCVQLDGARPGPGLEMQLSVAPRVAADAGQTPDEVFGQLEAIGCLRESMIGAADLPAKKRKRRAGRVNGWRIAAIALAVLFAALLIGLVGWFGGWFSGAAGAQVSTVTVSGAAQTQGEVTLTTWSDPFTRELLLSRTTGGSLYLCGNAFVSDGTAIGYADGGWNVAGTAVSKGDLSDLSPLAKKTGLTALSLVYQNITDVGALSKLTGLQYLDLSGNRIADLSPLASLTQLQTVKLLHVSAADLSVLNELPALRRVYVSLDMADRLDGIVSGDFEIIIKE